MDRRRRLRNPVRLSAASDSALRRALLKAAAITVRRAPRRTTAASFGALRNIAVAAMRRRFGAAEMLPHLEGVAVLRQCGAAAVAAVDRAAVGAAATLRAVAVTATGRNPC